MDKRAELITAEILRKRSILVQQPTTQQHVPKAEPLPLPLKAKPQVLKAKKTSTTTRWDYGPITGPMAVRGSGGTTLVYRHADGVECSLPGKCLKEGGGYHHE